MNKSWQQYAKRFDAQTLRERALIAISLLVAITFVWWAYYLDPRVAEIEKRQAANSRLQTEIDNSRAVLADIRRRIAAGVHNEQQAQLAKLQSELRQLEERLQVTTIELVDPEKMFQLMNQLLYRDSNLKLIGLRRRDVRPAFEVDETQGEQAGIYRHVLEIEFEGSYLDILAYVQSLERLDWKLLWDEIEIASGEYPRASVKIAVSTLSTRREWVGI